jgi:hypothetical protein
MVDMVKKVLPVRENYLMYLIEEWFEDTHMDKIQQMLNRNDLSLDYVTKSGNKKGDLCVPPITKPEGVTQDEMIKVIMNGTLWRKRDLLALEEREHGSIEDLYLKKLRNNEIARLDSNE